MYPRRFPRGRPPWWPENEAWPPQNAPRMWHAMRGRFFWRIGIFFGLFIFICVLFTLVLAWAVISVIGVFGQPVSGIRFLRDAGWLVLPVLLIGLLGVSWALRRYASPVGDLIEAAGRVAERDYAVRVPERGPREVRALAHAFNSMTARLQTNDEQRRALLADISHELRTPLTVMRGNLEAMLDGVYPLDRAHLEPVLDETRILSRLIEDLRTLALAESGALQLKKEPTDLVTLLNETLGSLRAQADAAGVELRVESAPDLPPATIDPARIREVLENVIGNALRYTPRGGVIRSRVFIERPQVIEIAISDTGAGIAADVLPHIFDRFYKARDSGGSGLGLAIAKNLVAAHGGEIFAESTTGQGTTIRFTLPLGA